LRLRLLGSARAEKCHGPGHLRPRIAANPEDRAPAPADRSHRRRARGEYVAARPRQVEITEIGQTRAPEPAAPAPGAKNRVPKGDRLSEAMALRVQCQNAIFHPFSPELAASLRDLARRTHFGRAGRQSIGGRAGRPNGCRAAAAISSQSRIPCRTRPPARRHSSARGFPVAGNRRIAVSRAGSHSRCMRLHPGRAAPAARRKSRDRPRQGREAPPLPIFSTSFLDGLGRGRCFDLRLRRTGGRCRRVGGNFLRPGDVPRPSLR